MRRRCRHRRPSRRSRRCLPHLRLRLCPRGRPSRRRLPRRQPDDWPYPRRPGRRDRGRGKRSPDGAKIPDVAKHPILQGEVRPAYDPRSTLYNTDGQIFSDAGIPVVLFMENYDINRTGYHDTHDTMDLIDLDYGAAVTAIAIESVARAATEKPIS